MSVSGQDVRIVCSKTNKHYHEDKLVINAKCMFTKNHEKCTNL